MEGIGVGVHARSDSGGCREREVHWRGGAVRLRRLARNGSGAREAATSVDLERVYALYCTLTALPSAGYSAGLAVRGVRSRVALSYMAIYHAIYVMSGADRSSAESKHTHRKN